VVSEHYCMLVFDDRSFHAERAHRQRGKDMDRKVYEGHVSNSDWVSLTAILDVKQFRELHLPPSAPVLVVQDSLKPYEFQLRPLLRWWKSSPDVHLLESNAPVDSGCSLSDADAIFSN
jgi:hypothetical protein